MKFFKNNNNKKEMVPILLTYKLRLSSRRLGNCWHNMPISLAPSFVMLLLMRTSCRLLIFLSGLIPSKTGLIPVSVKLLCMNDK